MLTGVCTIVIERAPLHYGYGWEGPAEAVKKEVGQGRLEK